MLLYRNTIVKVITEVIEPLLRRTIDRALSEAYGPQWFEMVGRDTMQSYQYFTEIESAVSNGVALMEAMDISAMMFLLDPHVDTDDSDEPEYLLSNNRLLDKISEYYQWDDRQKRKILRIRQIRNGSVHDKMDKNMLLNPEVIQNGVQEMKWLDDLEQAVLLMDPLANLNEFRNELASKIKLGTTNPLSGEKENDSTQHSNQSILTYIRETDSIRNDCRSIIRWDFMDAPVKMPISGPAPWCEVSEDLNSLPWPSEICTQNTQTENASTAKRAEVSSNDAVNKVFESVDKGVNKLFDWLNKKI